MAANSPMPFKNCPPSQTPGSFNPEKIQKQIEVVPSATNQDLGGAALRPLPLHSDPRPKKRAR